MPVAIEVPVFSKTSHLYAIIILPRPNTRDRNGDVHPYGADHVCSEGQDCSKLFQDEMKEIEQKLRKLLSERQ